MRQKSRGGIIDLNAEDSNVISIDSEDEVWTEMISRLRIINGNCFILGN